MVEIITLQEAKDYCRADSDFDDITLGILISAATEVVLNTADAWDDTMEVPDRLRLAVLCRVAESFDNREQVPTAKNEAGFLMPLRVLDI